MASDGSKAPKPYTQRHASTLFLRVPSDDWVAVTRGQKREFRASHRAVSQMIRVEPPTPVVAYRVHRTLGYSAELMVLEKMWKEPLGAISPESLEAEGFDSLAEFRRYWCSRERRRFMPTRMVTVYGVRPWQSEDVGRFSHRLFERLYGAFTE